ncbi:MAG: 3-hydroxyacyl-CoA dehydrogenase NAD-binding domain-containing protein [Candidatus Omnitrophica bacterium]|nr:3-hydroxyacyl-CoA dehydrogenase NAD-binding domain-containing protein [Candidatus Omnitrophota bacterium]MCM8769120.1 3-hydroxyacyl-CoA dehydrogenase NAD-binding domain-containing protein [Candidatus Omnitrophota bacterium]
MKKPDEKVSKTMVVGAGTMGCGIAQVLIESGFSVLLFDKEKSAVRKCRENIRYHLARKAEKGQIAWEEVDRKLTFLEQLENLEKAVEADFVIEAIVEDLQEKKNLFSRLDKLCREKTVLATNTSALSISEIARETRQPERIIGLHFFNPVPVMKLVEIVRGERTSEETVTRSRNLAEQIGKIPVLAKDSPGFIVNRLLIPLINEAIILVSEEVALKEDIDAAMKLGAGHPLGPLALADLIGLDVCLKIMETLEKQLNDPKFRPCQLLRDKVNQGKLGRKTGEGFYSYPREP